MDAKEAELFREMNRLGDLVRTGKATPAEEDRCLELEAKWSEVLAARPMPRRQTIWDLPVTARCWAADGLDVER